MPNNVKLDMKSLKSARIAGLAEICSKYPLTEKILIVPDYSTGRQVLECLARKGTNWINIRAAKTSTLAGDDLIVIEEDPVSGASRVCLYFSQNNAKITPYFSHLLIRG